MHASDLTTPIAAIYAEWIFWWVTWHVAALWQSRTVASGFGSGWPYIVMSIVGFVLLLAVYSRYGIATPHLLWVLTSAAKWAAVAVGALGVAFMWWARIHLGRLWSGGIVAKENHRVVDTGPYALVRHPIYTGLFALSLATMAVKGDVMAVAGAVLIIAAYTLKARLEERFLTGELGPAYTEYRRRVPMLIPFAAV